MASLKLRIEDLEREKEEMREKVKLKENFENTITSDLKMEIDHLHSKIQYLEKELAEKHNQTVDLNVKLESALARCEDLEKKTASKQSQDFSSQFKFVDEDEENIRIQENRERLSLTQRLDEKISKIKELEKDREHWKLEFQLSAMKMEKLKQPDQEPECEAADLEDILSMREEEIKSIWEARVEELIAERLLADSKAVAYFLEVEALTARLYDKKREGEKLSREASTARIEEDRARDEVALTQEKYESQLSVMSDHLASMTSKIADQEHLITQLNFQLKESK